VKRWFAFLLGVGLALGFGCGHTQNPPKPLLALWFWHSPFELSDGERKLLDKMGVDELFVRAGTLSTDGERIVLALPQRFTNCYRGPVHLVINADQGVLHRFEDLKPQELASTIVQNYGAAKAEASKNGLLVKGLQLDIDVPTRLLPLYAELLKETKARLGKGDQLSITSLATWFSSDDFRDVLEPLDFYAPQFYEASVPETLGEQKPIANLRQVAAGLKRAEALGKPFLIGAPAYGQALLFDEKGRLAGTYRGLSPEDACRHPSLKFERWAVESGEENLIVRANKPGVNGKGLGYRILYRRPTPEAIGTFYRKALAERPPNCLGVALFRMPEAGESLSIPLTSILDTLQERTPTLALAVSPTVTKRMYNAIEGGAPQTELVATVENVGTGDTCLSPEALRIEIRYPAGAADEIQAGGMAQALPFIGDPSSGGRVSLARSDGVVLWKAHFGVAEKVRLGPILLHGSGRLQIKWTATDPTGRKISGELPAIAFGGS